MTLEIMTVPKCLNVSCQSKKKLTVVRRQRNNVLTESGISASSGDHWQCMLAMVETVEYTMNV